MAHCSLDLKLIMHWDLTLESIYYFYGALQSEHFWRHAEMGFGDIQILTLAYCTDVLVCFRQRHMLSTLPLLKRNKQVHDFNDNKALKYLLVSQVTETRTGPLGCSNYDSLDSVSSVLVHSPENKIHLKGMTADVVFRRTILHLCLVVFVSTALVKMYSERVFCCCCCLKDGQIYLTEAI